MPKAPYFTIRYYKFIFTILGLFSVFRAVRGDRTALCVGLGIQLMREAVGEFEGGDEAGLLVQAAEITGQVDDGVLFLEGFIGQGIIEVIEGLFDLVGVLIAVRS